MKKILLSFLICLVVLFSCFLNNVEAGTIVNKGGPNEEVGIDPNTGDVWVGNYWYDNGYGIGALSKFDATTNTWTDTPIFAKWYDTSILINGIVVDDNRDVWVAYNAYDGDSNRDSRHIKVWDGSTWTEKTGISGNGTNVGGSLVRDSNGDIWYSNGRKVYKYNGTQFVEVGTAPESPDYCNELIAVPDGSVWYFGGGQYNQAYKAARFYNGVKTEISLPFGEEYARPLIGNDGQLWVFDGQNSSIGEMYRWDGNSFKKMFEIDWSDYGNFYTWAHQGVVMGQDGSFWTLNNTSEYLFRFNIDGTLETTNYLWGYRPKDIFMHKNGTLWLGGTKAYVPAGFNLIQQPNGPTGKLVVKGKYDGIPVSYGTIQYSTDGTNFTDLFHQKSNTYTLPVNSPSYWFRLKYFWNSNGTDATQNNVVYSNSFRVNTINNNPNVTEQTGIVSWDKYRGRTWAKLTWPSVPNAKGYKIYVWDGNTYRSKVLGNVLYWDSRIAKFFPFPGELPEDNSISTDLFRWDGSGLDLEDTFKRLFRSTVGTNYDNDNRAWFRITAYNDYMETYLHESISSWIGNLPDATDSAAPTITMFKESSGATYVGSSNITLSISAYDNESGIAGMQFSNDGSSWTSWESYKPTKNWTLTPGSGNKTVYMRMKDNVGNISAPVSFSVLVDTAAPTGSIDINSGATYTTSRTVTLNLSASDNAGGSGIDKMQFSINGGTNWGSKVNFTSNYSYTLSSDDGNKTVSVRFFDKAGNVSTTYNKSIILDTTSPTGSINTDTGKLYVDSQTITLSISGTDATSGVNQMKISNDSSFPSTAWESYVTTKSWILPSGNGSKTVYLKLKDRAGNVSSTYSVNLTLDTVNPTGSISVVSTNGLEKTNKEDVHVTISVSDANLDKVELSNDNIGNWQSVSLPISNPINWQVTPGSGTKTVKLRITDKAGNQTIKTDSIALVEDMLPPDVNIIINEGDIVTNSLLVDLNIDISDNASLSNDCQMRLSNDGEIFTGWQSFDSEITDWDLTKYGGNSYQGEHIVYVQIADGAQNMSMAKDEISYSTTSPSVDITNITDSVSGTYKGESVIFVNSSIINLDLDASAADKYRYNTGSGWTDWEAYINTPKIVLGQSGSYQLKVQVKDIYGATSTPVDEIVVVDSNAPNIKDLGTVSGARATSGSTIDIAVTATDDISTQLYYSINGGVKQALPVDGKITAPVSGTGIVDVNVSIYDEAGNVTTQNIGIRKL